MVQVGGSENNQQATLSIVSTNGIQNILSPGAPENATPQVVFELHSRLLLLSVIGWVIPVT